MICRKCNQDKGSSDFRAKRKVCISCEREYSRDQMLFYTYVITKEDRDNILLSQGSVCACCGSDSPNHKRGWHLDHNHKTGEIRAVLCGNCNIALGMVDDSTERLQLLIKYLERATTISKESTLSGVETVGSKDC